MDLRFELARVPEGHGADDYEDDEGPAYTLTAFAGGAEAGHLDINLKDRRRTLWIRWIEVEEAYRRQGVARALINEATRRYPKASVDTNDFTPEGEGFWIHTFGPI